MNSGLISVTFKGMVMQSIGAGAFQGCTRLTTFNWPSQIKDVSNDLFKGCTAFGQGYTVPEVIETIGSGAFSGTGITSLICSDSSQLWQISPSAFSSCSSLSSVRLHSGLTDIGESAFEGCSSLSTVQIRGTDKRLSLGKNVFANCKRGLTIYYCRTAEATGTSVFGGTENTVYVHQGYQQAYFAGREPTRVGSKTEIFVPVTENGLTYTFDGSKLSITGSGQAIIGNIEKATTGQCGACTGTLTNVKELFLESGVGLSDNLFQGCTNLQKVTYCGITRPEAKSLFANNQVQVNVPSIYAGDDFGGCTVTKSTDVDSICKIQTPTPVETTPPDPTTTPPDPTTPYDPTTTEQGAGKTKSNAGLIVGVIFALLAIILVLLILIWLFIFKRRKEDTTQDPDHELTEETVDSLANTESVYGTEMAETEENPLFARKLDFDEYRNDFEEVH